MMKKLFGLAAVAGLMLVAAPSPQAHAVSLNNPGLAASVQGANEGLVTDVQYRRHPHMGRHYGWRRPHFVRRHYGWHRPRFHHRRHWR